MKAKKFDEKFDRGEEIIQYLDLAKGRRPAWKKALEESLAQAESGKGRFFASDAEFMSFLEKESKKSHREKKSK